MNRKLLKTGLFLAVCLLIAGAGYLLVSPGDSLAVIHPVRGPAVQAVYATGTVEAKVMLPLAPRTTGRLVALFADEGDDVAKGEVLAQLEDDDLRKNLAELQAQAEVAQKEFERQSALRTRNVASQQAVDRALAERDAALAAVERVQAQLDFLKLTAPDSGRIIRRDGEVGELIQAGEPVFWLSCCDGLRVEAEVDEEDIAQVSPGQDVVILADAFPDQVFSGTVNSITPKGDPVSRSYRVRIDLEPDTPLMIGMTAETNIVIRKDDNALLVPASALTENDKVLVVTGGKLKAEDVQIGARTPEALEVSAGLDESALVVLDPEKAPEKDEAVKTTLQKWEAP